MAINPNVLNPLSPEVAKQQNWFRGRPLGTDWNQAMLQNISPDILDELLKRKRQWDFGGGVGIMGSSGTGMAPGLSPESGGPMISKGVPGYGNPQVSPQSLLQSLVGSGDSGGNSIARQLATPLGKLLLQQTMKEFLGGGVGGSTGNIPTDPNMLTSTFGSAPPEAPMIAGGWGDQAKGATNAPDLTVAPEPLVKGPELFDSSPYSQTNPGQYSWGEPLVKGPTDMMGNFSPYQGSSSGSYSWGEPLVKGPDITNPDPMNMPNLDSGTSGGIGGLGQAGILGALGLGLGFTNLDPLAKMGITTGANALGQLSGLFSYNPGTLIAAPLIASLMYGITNTDAERKEMERSGKDLSNVTKSISSDPQGYFQRSMQQLPSVAPLFSQLFQGNPATGEQLKSLYGLDKMSDPLLGRYMMEHEFRNIIPSADLSPMGAGGSLFDWMNQSPVLGSGLALHGSRATPQELAQSQSLMLLNELGGGGSSRVNRSVGSFGGLPGMMGMAQQVNQSENPWQSYYDTFGVPENERYPSVMSYTPEGYEAGNVTLGKPFYNLSGQGDLFDALGNVVGHYNEGYVTDANDMAVFNWGSNEDLQGEKAAEFLGAAGNYTPIIDRI